MIWWIICIIIAIAFPPAIIPMGIFVGIHYLIYNHEKKSTYSNNQNTTYSNNVSNTSYSKPTYDSDNEYDDEEEYKDEDDYDDEDEDIDTGDEVSLKKETMEEDLLTSQLRYINGQDVKLFFENLENMFESSGDYEYFMNAINAITNDLIRYQLEKGVDYPLEGTEYIDIMREYGNVNELFNEVFTTINQMTLEYLEKDTTKAALLTFQMQHKYYGLAFHSRLEAYRNAG